MQDNPKFVRLDNSTQDIMTALIENRRILQDDLTLHLESLAEVQKKEHAMTRTLFTQHSRDNKERRMQLSFLESLRFPTMSNRQEAIPEAHKRTLEWIFRSADKENPWYNFPQWLVSDNDVYWVNGKAGSGKSTLLKFLSSHSETQHQLATWANGARFETPAFFFWRAGEPDQRSHAGLVRSLLFEVLRSNMDLIQLVFPSQWKQVNELVEHDLSAAISPWTLPKLKEAFSRLVNLASTKLRFCIFIDGLDEYEGDYNDIAKYFSDLAKSNFVKFCISSRPLTVFRDIFRNYPQLRLQDLTFEDIKRYTEETLNSDTKVRDLFRKEPQRAASLVKSIINKADGVFLWVNLVVRSLLTGLGNRDAIPHLERRLESFPPDLENFYAYMLSSVDPVYKEDMSKIFQLHEMQSSMASDGGAVSASSMQTIQIGLELLHLAVSSKLEVTLAAEFKAPRFKYVDYYEEYFEKLVDDMEALVQSRCGGMMEVWDESGLKFSKAQPAFVRGELFYTHRTTADYIRRSDVWSSLTKHAKYERVDDFHPILALIQACILSVKASPLRGQESLMYFIRIRWRTFRYLIQDFVSKFSIDVLILLLDEFDKSATALAGYSSSGRQNIELIRHWANDGLPISWHADFLSLATMEGLWWYVDKKLERDTSLLRRESGISLLSASIVFRPNGFYFEDLPKQLATINTLLRHGADPKEMYRGYTLWQYWVHLLHAWTQKRHADRDEKELSPAWQEPLSMAFKSMLRCGVDLDVCCILERKVWTDIYDHGNLDTHPLEGGLRRRDLSMHGQGCGDVVFEERHCLTAIITDCFEGYAPNLAEELLIIIDKLKSKPTTEQQDVQPSNKGYEEDSAIETQIPIPRQLEQHRARIIGHQ